MSQANFGQQGVVPYSALIGQVLQRRRSGMGFHQVAIASGLGISQSAYSRLESGETVLSLSQLWIVAGMLRTTGANILAEADQVAFYLQQQGVQITEEKKDNSAAVLIGLGLLAAAVVALGSSQ
jgi:transcriptional regulator with XRE-family HTH domain